MTEPKNTLDDDERAEEMTRAPQASPEDAAPRIELGEGPGGATRIDIADSAVVRPGRPEPREVDGEAAADPVS